MLQKLPISGVIRMPRLFQRSSRPESSRCVPCSQIKTIEVVAVKRGHENAADLMEIACELEFLSRASNREIIHKNMALLDSALGDTTEFAEFEITKMLNTKPDTSAKHG